MTKEDFFTTYTQGLASSGKTRSIYMRFAREFLEHADGNLSREAVNSFLGKLRKAGYSDGTVNFAFRVVRTLFNRNKVDWPFRRGEAPQIHEDKVVAPALHPDTVGRAITEIKAKGAADEMAFLALSTVYGLRRSEMVALGVENVDISGQTIYISTMKHGRERTHLIPPEIIPALQGYDFSQKISENYIFTLWYRIEHRISLPHSNRLGWHSIRRTLNTLLMRRLPESTVMSFMRWKQRTSSHMPFRYSAVTFVGDEGLTKEVVGEALDTDSTVFKVHPFLEYWR